MTTIFFFLFRKWPWYKQNNDLQGVHNQEFRNSSPKNLISTDSNFSVIEVLYGYI